MRLPRRKWLQIAGVGLPASISTRAAGVAAATFPTTVASRVERLFKTPGPQPNGLQATPEGLWILDQNTNHASLVSYSDGKVIRDLATESDRGSGITFDGSAIWIASTYNRLILKVDAHTGKTLKQFPTPGAGVVKWPPRSAHPAATGAHGMEFSRGELFVAVPPAATVYVMNPEDGSVIRSFPAPGVRPHGIGWDPNGNLWCTESIYRSFFRMNRNDGKISKQIMLPPLEPMVDGLVQTAHGMTIRDKQIWFCVAETAEVYRVSPTI